MYRSCKYDKGCLQIIVPLCMAIKIGLLSVSVFPRLFYCFLIVFNRKLKLAFALHCAHLLLVWASGVRGAAVCRGVVLALAFIQENRNMHAYTNNIYICMYVSICVCLIYGSLRSAHTHTHNKARLTAERCTLELFRYL